MDDFERPQPSPAGTQVTRTGIALVHENEVIRPLPESLAGTEPIADASAVVQYYFPVEVEVRAAPEPIDPDSIVERALEALANGLA